MKKNAWGVFSKNIWEGAKERRNDSVRDPNNNFKITAFFPFENSLPTWGYIRKDLRYVIIGES